MYKIIDEVFEIALIYTDPAGINEDLDDRIRSICTVHDGEFDGSGCLLGEGGSRDMQFTFKAEADALAAAEELEAIKEIESMSLQRTTLWGIRGHEIEEPKA